MAVEKKTLGLEEDGKINILDVKCDPDLVGMIIQTHGFLPGYHMNKRHWITILLDESVSEAKTLDFLDMSYEMCIRDRDCLVDIFSQLRFFTGFRFICSPFIVFHSLFTIWHNCGHVMFLA